MDNNEFQKLVLEQFEKMNTRLDSMDTRLGNLEKGQIELQQSQVRMEGELTEKVRVLLDAREVQNDINTRIMETLGRIEAKVEVLQLETASIRSVK